MGRVVIGMDPHKRSATIEAIDERERVLAKGRFGTDTMNLRLAGISTIPSSRANADISGVTSNSVGVPVG